MDCGCGGDWSVPGVAVVAAYARPVASLPSVKWKEHFVLLLVLCGAGAARSWQGLWGSIAQQAWWEAGEEW